jgi:hypothetical protein
MFANQRHSQAQSQHLHLEKNFGNFTPAGLSKAGRALMGATSYFQNSNVHFNQSDGHNFKNLPKLDKLKHVEKTFKQSRIYLQLIMFM